MPNVSTSAKYSNFHVTSSVWRNKTIFLLVLGKMGIKSTCPSVRPYVSSPKTLNEFECLDEIGFWSLWSEFVFYVSLV